MTSDSEPTEGVRPASTGVAGPDPSVEGVLRDAGYSVTETGRERWRRRLAKRIPAEAREEGRRILDRARDQIA